MLELPLFPLHAVLFPGMPLNLHIFEPRYRLMIRQCIERQTPFGVALIWHGVEALGPLAEPHSFGCAARIVNAEALDDGCMNITVLGEERFRILEVDRSQSYLVGKVETRPIENPHPLEVLRGLPGLYDLVYTYLALISAIHKDEPDLSKIELPEDSQGILFMAASLLQLPVVEKQPLLEADTASLLFKQLIRLYRREITVIRSFMQSKEETARRSAWLN